MYLEVSQEPLYTDIYRKNVAQLEHPDQALAFTTAVRTPSVDTPSGEKTPVSEHFWKLRCRKSASPCGAKQISKSTCENYPGKRPQTVWAVGG